MKGDINFSSTYDLAVLKIVVEDFFYVNSNQTVYLGM